MSNRAALYLRVSTTKQTTENQRRDLEKMCEAKGWEITKVYEDHGISGAKGRKARPALDELLKDAAKRRFDIAVFWSVDRLGRSTSQVTTAMDEMQIAGVKQFYHKESIDTSSPHGQAMLEMAAVFAKLERSMIQERVKSGLERAKANGVRLGKKPLSKVKQQEIIKARASGLSFRKTAAACKVSTSTVYKVLNEAAIAC